MRTTFLFFVAAITILGMTQTSRLSANEPDHNHGADHHADSQEHMTSHVVYRPLTPEDIERFHGHLGPYVMLGVRMGEHACGELKMPRFFDLTVVVECFDGPPQTCMIDGLQLSTGATMGKETISHKVADQIRVTMKEAPTGRIVVYQLKDSTRELLAKWKAEKVHLDDQSIHIYKMKPEDLFEIEISPAK